MDLRSWRSVSRPGFSVCSTWLVLNIIHIQSSDPKIDYMDFHCPMSSVIWPVFQYLSQSSSHPNHRTSAFFAKGFSCLFVGLFIVTGFGSLDLHIRHPWKVVWSLRKETQETSPGSTTTVFNQVFQGLRNRIVGQGGTRVLSVVFRCFLFVRLYYSTNPRGSIFYVCVYISVVHVYLYELFA